MLVNSWPQNEPADGRPDGWVGQVADQPMGTELKTSPNRATATEPGSGASGPELDFGLVFDQHLIDFAESETGDLDRRVGRDHSSNSILSPSRSHWP